uniref:Immunoglobulin subtype domain-containing protein n=1 Tax=Fundulus heteroclitus TaxID=8078 RepID=A0A3Q2QJ92_FUNHE
TGSGPEYPCVQLHPSFPRLLTDHASGGKHVIHKKVGDSVEISSNLPTEGVSRATWKYGDSKVAEQGLGVTGNNPFKARVQFNNVTFSLTIRDLTLQDSGDFSFTSATNDQQRPTVFITLLVHGRMLVLIQATKKIWGMKSCLLLISIFIYSRAEGTATADQDHTQQHPLTSPPPGQFSTLFVLTNF